MARKTVRKRIRKYRVKTTFAAATDVVRTLRGVSREKKPTCGATRTSSRLRVQSTTPKVNFGMHIVEN